MRNQRSPGLAVTGTHHLQDVVGDARLVQSRHRHLDAAGRRMGRFDDDRGTRSQCGQHRSHRDGHREVPRRGHQHHLVAGEPRTGDASQIFSPVGVVAGEVDRLADLRVGLGHGLATLGGHHGDQRTPARLQLACRLTQQVGAFGQRTPRPAARRRRRGRHDPVHVGGRAQHR